MTAPIVDADEAHLLLRLSPHGVTGRFPVCGFYHHADQAIIRRLEAAGQLTAWMGEGKDHGLLLARLIPRKPHAVATAGDIAG